MNARSVRHVIESVPTSDGAGVKLRRSLGSGPFARLDPFLMLDEFYSDNPDDYLAGFPSHPHRVFETVTYMLDGRMEHKDHLGNTGDLGPGSVQWMTAGRGVIHSEMPRQSEGRMRGFQLWINLPAREKMKPADYRDIPSGDVPELAFDGGIARIIAGTLDMAGQRVDGAVNGTGDSMSTDPLYIDLRLDPGSKTTIAVKSGHNSFVYLYEGDAVIGYQLLQRRNAGVLDGGDQVTVQAGDQGARLLLLAGKPLDEPVVQYGPFVMNTREEIEQALSDYQEGRLTEPA